MSETMKALAVTELCKRAELRDMPRPQAGANEVLVKTHYSGVSVGTEMWIAYGRRNDYGDVPFVNGYQATGEIVEVGEGVEEFAPGDLVAVFCRGAHAEYVVGSASLTHKLPDHSIAACASLFVQPSVGTNALNLAEVSAGDNLLVVGQGLIGQCTAIVARLRGAYVVASDISPERLEISRNHCADWTIDAGGAPVSQQVSERFPGLMDVVMESTGFQQLLNDAFACCRHGGKFIFEGWYPDNVQFDFQVPHGKQLKAFFPVFIGPRPIQQSVLRWMASGHLDMRPLISHQVRWQESEVLYNQLFTPQRDHFNGIVIDWTS